MNQLAHAIPAEWLAAYYDGELDGPRRDQVVAHLPTCADCQRELEGLKTLSQVLADERLPQEGLTGTAAFWRGVQRQLPERRPTQAGPAHMNIRSILLRWSPGIGLLLLNAFLRVAAGAGTALMLVPARLATVPDWANWGYRLLAGSSLGWLAWVLPSGWSWLGLIVPTLTLSGGLAVLYVAWLGYELRYGAPATFARATALRGD